jgi:hypothetical protein
MNHMNREDIIRMAEEAGLEKVVAEFSDGTKITSCPPIPGLKNFARLVAAAEREACAKVCDARYMGDNNREDMEAKRCAAAIRARGEQSGHD